jgi:hypothetical protein
MAFSKIRIVAVMAALSLGGCSFVNGVYDKVNKTLFPSDTPTQDQADNSGAASNPADEGAGDQAAPNPSAEAAPPADEGVPVQQQAQASPAPTMQANVGQPTGTIVGRKVAQLQGDLGQLRSRLTAQVGTFRQIQAKTVQDSQVYHGTIAAIEARLQIGTTPGNPILVQQWNDAQTELDHVNDDVLRMNRLSTEVSATSSMGGYLLDSVRAARTLSGGVDEDFRQLTRLEDDTNTTSVTTDRLLTDLATNIQRQQAYVAGERANLNEVAVAIRNGQAISSGVSAYDAVSTGGGAGGWAASSPSGGYDRPLVVLRFDRPNLQYQDALYTAVKAALERRPGAMFEVVAVSPSTGTAGGEALSETRTRRHASEVARSLSEIGLPQGRVRISSQTSASVGSAGEVQVYVR